MSSASTLIGSAVVPAVVACVLGFLMRSVSKRAVATPGGLLLRYGTTFRVFALGAVAITLGLAVAFFLVEPEGKVPVLIAVVLFGGLSVPLLLETFGVAIELRSDHIVARSPWRRARQIPLADVQSVSFSKAMQWYVVQTGSHGAVRLHLYLSGVPEFLAALQSSTSPTGPKQPRQ